MNVEEPPVKDVPKSIRRTPTRCVRYGCERAGRRLPVGEGRKCTAAKRRPIGCWDLFCEVPKPIGSDFCGS